MQYGELMTFIFLGSSDHIIAFSLLLLVTGVFLCVRMNALFACDDQERKKIVYGMILAAYCLSGTSAVIVMVSKYNILMDDRYLIQYSWIIVASITYAITTVFAWLQKRYQLPRKPFAGLIPVK